MAGSPLPCSWPWRHPPQRCLRSPPRRLRRCEPHSSPPGSPPTTPATSRSWATRLLPVPRPRPIVWPLATAPAPAVRNQQQLRTGSIVDVDNDPNTFNSSRADFNLPDGGEVLWAGLYWGGRNNDNAARGPRCLPTPRPPPDYQTDQRRDHRLVRRSGRPTTHSRNVTNLVQQGGSGTSRGANVQANDGHRTATRPGRSWLSTAQPGAPPRNLTVFDGFADVANNSSRSRRGHPHKRLPDAARGLGQRAAWHRRLRG